MADTRLSLEQIPDAVLKIGGDGVITAVNTRAADIFGYEAAELLGRKVEALVPQRFSHHAKLREAHVANPGATPMAKLQRVWACRKDGTEFPVDVSIKTMPEGDSVCFVRDITEQVRLSDQIRESAYRDITTSALNRRAFYDHLAAMLASPPEGSDGLAVAVFDLDHFKDVNDSLGHQFGDEILVEFCLRVQSLVPEQTSFYRLGGDEFALIMPEHGSHAPAVSLVNEIIAANRKSYLVEGHRFAIGCSVGIVHAPTDGDTVEELLANADLALYEAKATRGTASVFSPHLRDAVEQRFAMLSELRIAGEEGQFELHFQPKVDGHSEAVIGAEALLRWAHPTRGLLSPAQFIDVLTDSDLSVTVGRWTLFEACRQAAEWNRRSDRKISVAVNLFPWQVKARTFHDDIVGALGDAGLEAGRLELELTENTIVESSDDFIAMLHDVRAMGVGIALDDFGTGFASLNSRTSFPIDTIKIDRSFVRDVGAGRGNWPVLRAMPKLARDLGLRSVAEGVETLEDAVMVRHFGYDFGQGYYWGKPMPAAAFIDRFAGAANPSRPAADNGEPSRPIQISELHDIVKRRFPMLG